MQISKPIRTVGNVVLVFFAVIGGIMSLAQAPALWQASEAKSITVLKSDVVLVAQGEFTREISYSGTPIGSSQLVETTVTLWRDGGAPITSEMVRRPVEIKLPPGSTVVGAKIVAQESSIENNFTLESDDATVTINWRVFDPDMAVKIAIARLGTVDAVQISESLGPGITTTYSRYNFAKSIYWWGMFLLGSAVVIPMFFTVATIGMDTAVSVIHRLTSRFPLFFRVSSFVLGMPLYLGSSIALVFGTALAFAWLIDSVVPPIPFN